ncbi:MAG: M23 family metallopeptidase, partial [Gammaproteobacteria bacterium]|nr:M23 family metallopeptidase [Gammaproteobacteria bacterium]
AGDLRYAYDFGLPVYAKVVASKGGRVFNVIDKNPNYIASLSTVNFILIQHYDETIARYIHLTQDGALVEIGDEVNQGDIIGLSGSSGTSIPHLHFDVFEEDSISCTMGHESYDAAGGIMVEHGCKTIPITFRNSEPLDTPLLRSKSYRALDINVE